MSEQIEEALGTKPRLVVRSESRDRVHDATPLAPQFTNQIAQ